jgi:hypothetical protein
MEFNYEPMRGHSTRECGDNYFVATWPRGFGTGNEVELTIGRDNLKTPTTRAAIFHWHTDNIPLGVTVEKAKLTMVASQTNSTVLDFEFEPLALNPKLNHEAMSFHDGLLTLNPASFITALWDHSDVVTYDDVVKFFNDHRNGLGSVGQTWTANQSVSGGGGIFGVVALMERSGIIGGGRVWFELSIAEGSAGEYYKGDTIWTSDTHEFADINNGSPAGLAFTKAAGPDPEIVSGQVYIAELAYEYDENGDPNAYWAVALRANPSTSPDENFQTYGIDGGTTLHGFLGLAQFKSGQTMSQIAREGVDTVAAPAMTSGDTYVFGHADYSTTNFTELPNFTSLMQTLLDNRTSSDDLIGLRLRGVPVAGRERFIHSIRAGVVTMPGLYGTVLTLDVSLPDPDPEPDLRTPSETQIANAALVALGERRINSLSDNTKTANLILTRFDDVRDALLRSMVWNFAVARDELAAATIKPRFQFTYSYPLPTDCLRVLEVDNRWGFDWRVEGNAVVTDITSPLQITYIRRITDPTKMDPLFRQLFAVALAFELCEAITGDDDKLIGLSNKHAILLDEARTAAGQDAELRELDLSMWQTGRGEKQ